MPSLVDPVGKVGTRAREADPFPGGHAAIAAVERVGEVALAGVLQQLREERRGRRAGQLNLIFLQRCETSILLVGREVHESLARAGRATLVRRGKTRSIQLPRRVA